MFKKIKRVVRVNFLLTKDHKSMLDKLALIYEGSRTDVIEVLIEKAAKEYGLIESRE